MQNSKVFSDKPTASSSSSSTGEALPANLISNLKQISGVNQQFAEFWAMWECAKFFVNSKYEPLSISISSPLPPNSNLCYLRLRTPLGSPAESLAAAEKLIARMTTAAAATSTPAAASESAQYSINVDDFSSETSTQIGLYTSDEARISSTRHRFSRLALLFIDTLERHIYNGYEGSVSMTPVSSAGTLSFFKANKKSCADWFTKVRPRLLLASVASTSNYDTIRHAQEASTIPFILSVGKSRTLACFSH